MPFSANDHNPTESDIDLLEGIYKFLAQHVYEEQHRAHLAITPLS